MNPKRIAVLFAGLLTKELGYTTFLAHGGDWGSNIAEQLTLYHGDALLGIHLTDVPFQHTMKPPDDATSVEKAYLKATQKWQQAEGAYALIQATKPQTVAYSLADSPAAQIKHLHERFCSGKWWTALALMRGCR